jgi:hypothetical protein
MLATLVVVLVACGDDSSTQPAAQLHPLAGDVEVEIDG